MKSFLKRLFRFLSSPWLTTVLLVASMVLVLFGTLEQHSHDIRSVQKHYFEAWLATWPMPASPDVPAFRLCLPLPGGFTLGLALLVNLACAAARFFRLNWGKLGVGVIHAGVVVLLVGGFAIAAWQEEYQMIIPEGEGRNYVEAEVPPAAAGVQAVPKRLELPFTLHLDKFTHEVHPGSTIAKSYSSALRIVPKGGKLEEGRPVLVRMNNPLRHEGFSFFQSSFGHNPDGREFTVLQVVRNPGWALPYAAFYLMGAGMLLQFLISLVKFAGKGAHKVGAAAKTAAVVMAVYLAGGAAEARAQDGQARAGTDAHGHAHEHAHGQAQAGATTPAVAPASAANLSADDAERLSLPAVSAAVAQAASHTTANAAPLVQAFAGLPVQYNGRLQPTDSLARNTLLILSGKQSVAFNTVETVLFGVTPFWRGRTAESAADGTRFDMARLTAQHRETFEKHTLNQDPATRALLHYHPVPLTTNGLTDKGSLSATAWLMEVAFRPSVAAHFCVFRVENAEVRDLIHAKKPGAVANYSWNELRADSEAIEARYNEAIKKKTSERTAFEHGIVKLGSAMLTYISLGDVFVPADMPPGVSPVQEYAGWSSGIKEADAILKAAEQARATGNGAPPPMLARAPAKISPELDARLKALSQRYNAMAQDGRVGIVPPRTDADKKSGRWETLGSALFPVPGSGQFEPPAPVRLYGELHDAWQAGDFAKAVKITADLDAHFRATANELPVSRLSAEVSFNRAEPFYKCLIFYIGAFLFVCLGWALKSRRMLGIAVWTVALVFVLHTVAIGARMWIQDRPPVTNLYSTAIVVAWGAVLLGIVVERFLKNGVGAAAAAIAGFASLIIAHNLAMNGDTMGMMQAVLDDNFWLATHVVTITLGYSAMFVAGLLGALWILRRLFAGDKGSAFSVQRSEVTASPRDPIERVVYGVMCFALLLSFAGTMLGGLWADKSWGRFWGWDPKENGALLVVLWCAVFLHARVFRLAGTRGLMQIVVFGNIITAASWFGTNLLGTGLHSYGFSEGGFSWLCLFWVSQLVIIALAWIPRAKRKVVS